MWFLQPVAREGEWNREKAWSRKMRYTFEFHSLGGFDSSICPPRQRHGTMRETTTTPRRRVPIKLELHYPEFDYTIETSFISPSRSISFISSFDPTFVSRLFIKIVRVHPECYTLIATGHRFPFAPSSNKQTLFQTYPLYLFPFQTIFKLIISIEYRVTTGVNCFHWYEIPRTPC